MGFVFWTVMVVLQFLVGLKWTKQEWRSCSQLLVHWLTYYLLVQNYIHCVKLYCAKMVNQRVEIIAENCKKLCEHCFRVLF